MRRHVGDLIWVNFRRDRVCAIAKWFDDKRMYAVTWTMCCVRVVRIVLMSVLIRCVDAAFKH